MSAQRSVPSAAAPGSTVRVVAALLLGIAAGAAIALLVTARATDATRRRTTVTSSSPDKSRVAVVQEAPCSTGMCEELRLGDLRGGQRHHRVARQPLVRRDRVDARRQARRLRDRWFGDVDLRRAVRQARGYCPPADQRSRANPPRPRHHVLGERPRRDIRRLPSCAFRLPRRSGRGAAIAMLNSEC